VERRALGRTGISVPVVGLGTARGFNARGDADQARCEVVIDTAIRCGASLLDTSPMYGEAEDVLALALEGRRGEALVATKVWAKTRAIGEQQVEQALGKFGYVDLYQVHNLLGAADYLPIFRALVKAGRVRAVGVSHYLPSAYPALLEIMRSGMVDAIQVPYHPGERTVEAELLPEAERLGIAVIVDALAPLAGAGVHTWAQALLKWALSDPRISCAIPATSRPEHLEENAAAGRPPWLSPAERRVVEELSRA
jgi:aryl-alcohol dehydrogenase-like predicted oxidoreductase